MHRIEKTEALRNALLEVSLVCLERKRSPDVDRVEVHWRLAVSDPVCEGPANASCRLDTYRVEAGSDETTLDLRRFTHVVDTVRGERLRAVEEQLETALTERRHSMNGPLEDRPDVFPVFWKRAE